MRIINTIDNLDNIQVRYNINQDDKGRLTTIVFPIIHFMIIPIIFLGLLSHPLAREDVKIDFLAPYTSFVLSKYPDSAIINMYGVTSIDKFLTLVVVGVVLTILISIFIIGLIMRKDISRLIATEHIFEFTDNGSIRENNPEIYQNDNGDTILQFRSGQNWIEIKGYINEVISQGDKTEKHRVLITEIKETQTRQDLTDYDQAGRQTEPIEKYEFVDEIGFQLFPR